MKKRILEIMLVLVLTLSVLAVGSVAASAAGDTANITVGGKTYSLKVGDYFEYNLKVKYSSKNLSAAQFELPVDFTGLESYSQSELDSFISRIAPATASSSVALRSEGDSTIGINGYVMNFASVSGYSFNTEKTAFSLIFEVKKAGSYTLASKIRYVDDINGRTVINGNYRVDDRNFTYTESLDEVALETPKLRVSTDAGGMMISWDAVPRASLYRVYYKGRNGWTRLADTKDTSFLDTDVESGVRYTYTVRCLSEDGSRFVSDYDHDGKSAVYYTAPIINLTNNEDSVKLSWDAVPQADRYRVYIKDGNGWAKLTDTTDTAYTHEDTVSGRVYTYTVRCMDTDGNHLSWYYPEGFSIKFLTAPHFSLSNAANGVKISWDAVEGAEKYRVFYYGSKGWTRLADTSETSFIDTDVNSNSNYRYTVRCITEDGSAYTSDFRAGKSIKYIAAPILKLSNGEDGVKISWDAVSGASKYRVYYKGRNGWTKLEDTSSTSVLDTDVSSGTSYTYTIRCMDNNGNHISSYYADGFKITYITAPTFSVSNDAGGVEISWKPVSGAVRYRVFYYGSKGWTRLADTSETSFIDTDVTSNHTYRYTVRCITEDGSEYTSDFRAGKSVKYIAAPILKLSSESNGVRISWDAVDGASKYRVYYKGRNGWTKLEDTSATSILDTDVTKGTSYTYTIRCMDNSGNLISWYYTDGFKVTF